MMARVLYLLGALLPLALGLSVSTHLTPADRSRFASLLSSSLAPSSDLASLHYSILGSSLLGEKVPAPGPLCAQLAASQGATSVETLYQVWIRIYSQLSLYLSLSSRPPQRPSPSAVP